jgi:hypothetical protein
MMRHGTSEGLILSSSRRLVAYEVRIGAAETCRAYGLMSIDHDLMLGSLLQCIKIMIDERLAVVVLAYRKDISYISALDGVIAILVHELESLIDMTLVITYR